MTKRQRDETTKRRKDKESTRQQCTTQEKEVLTKQKAEMRVAERNAFAREKHTTHNVVQTGTCMEKGRAGAGVTACDYTLRKKLGP
jgi:hypothetical protein